MGLIAYVTNEGAHKPAPQSVRSRISVLLCPIRDLLEVTEKNISNTWPDRANGYLCQLYEHMTYWHFFLVLIVIIIIIIHCNNNNNNNNLFCDSCSSWTFSILSKYLIR